MSKHKKKSMSLQFGYIKVGPEHFYQPHSLHHLTNLNLQAFQHQTKTKGKKATRQVFYNKNKCKKQIKRQLHNLYRFGFDITYQYKQQLETTGPWTQKFHKRFNCLFSCPCSNKERMFFPVCIYFKFLHEKQLKKLYYQMDANLHDKTDEILQILQKEENELLKDVKFPYCLQFKLDIPNIQCLKCNSKVEARLSKDNIKSLAKRFCHHIPSVLAQKNKDDLKAFQNPSSKLRVFSNESDLQK